MRKDFYLPDFDSNKQLMATCPNGPGADYWNNLQSQTEEDAWGQGWERYCQEQERQGDLYMAYGTEQPFEITPKK
jgi:hypothetical protein